MTAIYIVKKHSVTAYWGEVVASKSFTIESTHATHAEAKRAADAKNKRARHSVMYKAGRVSLRGVQS